MMRRDHHLRALVVGGLAGVFAGVQAWAVTFHVDDTSFRSDANPGDGVCASAVGTCTLWAAVDEANALPGTDTVNIPAGSYLCQPDTYGASLAITDAIELNGAGADVTIIDANRPAAPPIWYIRVVGIWPAVMATVRGVTVRNGIQGIENAGTLILIDSIVRDNHGNGMLGTGITSSPNLTVIRSSIIENEGAGISSTAGYNYYGVLEPTAVEIRDSVVANNGSHGIENYAESAPADMLVVNTHVRDNGRTGIYSGGTAGASITIASRPGTTFPPAGIWMAAGRW